MTSYKCDLNLGDVIMEKRTKPRFLGISLYENMSFKEHNIEHLTKKLNLRVKIMQTARPYLDKKTKIDKKYIICYTFFYNHVIIYGVAYCAHTVKLTPNRFTLWKFEDRKSDFLLSKSSLKFIFRNKFWNVKPILTIT